LVLEIHKSDIERVVAGEDGMKYAPALWAITTAFLLLTTTQRAAAQAQGSDAFYRGKTVTIVVGYSAGGGYDQYARLVARHLGRYIPGNPSVIVQNMPGAATLTSVRHLDANAARDGTVITMFDPGLILESFASADQNRTNFANYQWIGALLRDIRVCYASTASGVRNWDEMMNRKEFLIGNTARGSNAYVNGAILRKVFHAPVRQISGYPGSNEQRLALERGELEGNCGSWSAIPHDWIVNRHINALVRFSPKRPPDMPVGVPYVLELARTQEQKELLPILNGPGELGRPFIVAKQVPADRVKILRAAFDAILKDAAFWSEAQKQNLPLDPVSGEEAEAVIATIYSASPQMGKKAKEVLD
jgi:tripartite-type tricarboxylate transporter receptor subunit TctC